MSGRDRLYNFGPDPSRFLPEVAGFLYEGRIVYSQPEPAGQP